MFFILNYTIKINYIITYYFSFLFRLKKIQDKKRIARAKADVRKAELIQEMLDRGEDPHQSANMLDEGDEDLLF